MYTREDERPRARGCSRGRRARVALVRIGVCARGGGPLWSSAFPPRENGRYRPSRFVTPNPSDRKTSSISATVGLCRQISLVTGRVDNAGRARSRRALRGRGDGRARDRSACIRLTATVRVRGPDPRGDIAASSAFFAVSGFGVRIHHRALSLRAPTAARVRGGARGDCGTERARRRRRKRVSSRAPRALRALFRPPRRRERGWPARARCGGARPTGCQSSSVPEWIPATALGAVVPPDAAAAVESLVGPRGLGALHRGWFVGGAAPVAPGFAASRRQTDASSAFAPGDAPLSVGVAVAGLVIIRVPAPSPGTSDRSPGTLWSPGASPRPGDAVMACGSPFGVLAPSHFAASALSGSVSGTWPGTPPGPERRKIHPRDPRGRRVDTNAASDAGRANPPRDGRWPRPRRNGRAAGHPHAPLARSTRAAREQRVPASSNPADDADGADVAPLALSIACVRRALLDFSAGPRTRRTRASSTSAPNVSPPSKTRPKRVADAGVRTVVLIETDDGASWASGVIVRAGRPGGAEGPARSALALTNAHVVRPSAVPPPAARRRPRRARRPRTNRHRKMDRRRAHSYLEGPPTSPS